MDTTPPVPDGASLQTISVPGLIEITTIPTAADACDYYFSDRNLNPSSPVIAFGG